MANVESSSVAVDNIDNNNDQRAEDVHIKLETESDEGNDTSNAKANSTDDAQNDQEDNEKTNLIVNYLPQQMTDEEFENLFKKFGSMKSCKIVRNRISGYSYGFGFVDFQTHKQAIKAIEELNGFELQSKKIKVAFARPAGQDIKQANLYIKNVPHDWSQDDVKKVFEPYGNIIQVRVLSNNRGIAFVLFDLRKQAEDALEALNGKKVEGSENPLEIKFAADKKLEKGGNRNSSSTNNNNGNNSGGSTNPSGRRERGHRGGRSHNRNRNRQNNQRSFFDRQNKHDDRQHNNRGGGGGQNQYNAMPYAGGAQYSGNFNNMNGAGPIRQSSNNRMNRYAPFVPVQQPITAIPQTGAPMGAAMTAPIGQNPAYGFPTPQPMIPFAMLPTQQMAPMQAVTQPGQQLAQNQLGSMYGYTSVPQNVMNMYNVASTNLNNAANMQPQIGQPMTMRNNPSSGASGSYDDGVTLFVYNIGPDADENELRSMFSPHGQVVKCNVVRKTPGGETKGFGFVKMKDRDQANSAIAGLNGSMRNGRTLQVSLKK